MRGRPAAAPGLPVSRSNMPCRRGAGYEPKSRPVSSCHSDEGERAISDLQRKTTRPSDETRLEINVMYLGRPYRCALGPLGASCRAARPDRITVGELEGESAWDVPAPP